MDDQFLHRLRRDPPAGFASRLKRQLDRPAPLRPTRTHLILALAIFGSAFALTSPGVRHSVTQWMAAPGPMPAASTPQADPSHRDGSSLKAASTAAPADARNPSPAQLLPVEPVTESPPRPRPVVEAAPVVATQPPVVMATTITAMLQTPEQRALAAVLTRRGLFRLLGWVMQTSLSPVARGTAPFDEQRVALAAVRVQQLSLLIPEVFRTDTRFANFTSAQTGATPSIWTQQQDFDGKADALTAAADALADAAADHDREAAVDAIRQIATACNACHSAYTHTK